MFGFQVIKYKAGPSALIVPICGGLKCTSLTTYWWAECAMAFIKGHVRSGLPLVSVSLT